ncbi:hypothetical protein [Marinobacter sp. S0848L]|uniref:hypothetical protein n=1 Tax=Marinobacter sp. S0848L TaxID=2926423 RepID=UPI001FF67A2F|nr:hypothetical protein [Marinobacter sp. S0848L]MCK0106961.1 hypothetical protein [Marinobacter sp. S0848L]
MAKKPSDDKNGLQELIQKEGDALKALSRLDLCFEHRTQPCSKWDVRIPPYPDTPSRDAAHKDQERLPAQATEPLLEKDASKQIRDQLLKEASRELTQAARNKRQEQMEQRLSKQRHLIHRELPRNHHWKRSPLKVVHQQMKIICEVAGLDVKKGDMPKVTNQLAKKGYLPARFLKQE